jgi:hypothetical protein
MAKGRSRIQPERLGRSLRGGHDVLMPEPEPVADAATSESQNRDVKASKIQREPTTIRFTKRTLKELARARSHLLIERDLKVTQSDLVEAAVLHALQDLEGLTRQLESPPSES